MTTPYVRGMPTQRWLPDREDALDLLATAEVHDQGLLAAGSNYVYLLRMSHPVAGEGYAVYKPQRGEAPLSDFPDGTLYGRERAAYLVSEGIGWHLIPPTIVRAEGLPAGLGALQLFVEHDPSQNYFTLKDERVDEMKRVAVFDWLTNNADRKGGHCLLAGDGRLWCIDQGLTFHADDKLRTVIWDFQGEPVPADLVAGVAAFGERLRGDEALRSALGELITPIELVKLEERARLIVELPVYPSPPAWRPYPWPLV